MKDGTEFRTEFTPRDDVNYGWVVVHAKQQWDESLATFRRIDDKAGTVVGYVVGGTGLLTIGALSAVGSGTMHYWVALAAMPSVFLAAASLLIAVLARTAKIVIRPPSPSAAVGYAEFYPKAEESYIGIWVECITLLDPVIVRKAKLVNASLWTFAASVLALMLPLAVTIIRKAME